MVLCIVESSVTRAAASREWSQLWSAVWKSYAFVVKFRCIDKPVVQASFHYRLWGKVSHCNQCCITSAVLKLCVVDHHRYLCWLMCQLIWWYCCKARALYQVLALQSIKGIWWRHIFLWQPFSEESLGGPRDDEVDGWFLLVIVVTYKFLLVLW